MNSIERLSNDYGIRTHVSIKDRAVTFSGVYKWTDTFRRAKGKYSAWSEIRSLMREAEREARSINLI